MLVVGVDVWVLGPALGITRTRICPVVGYRMLGMGPCFKSWPNNLSSKLAARGRAVCEVSLGFAGVPLLWFPGLAVVFLSVFRRASFLKTTGP